MMIVRVALSALKEGRWYEYVVRFVLGGAVTVMTGLIGARWGPSVGGLFLAFPAMLCASATLVQSHEERRKRSEGLRGAKRGRDAAALEAAGAALGSFGLASFAAAMLLLSAVPAWYRLLVAAVAWAGTAGGAWIAYKRW